MDRPKKHRTLDFEKFLDYFKGILSKKEQHDFEKEVMQDPFAEEAYEGLTELTADELRQDMQELQTGLAERTRTRKTILLPVFRIAAAAILLLIAGTTAILIRNSVRKAPDMQEMAEALDTLVPQRHAAPVDEDSLKDNIAYVPDKKKGDMPAAHKDFIPEKEAVAPKAETEIRVSEEANEKIEMILPGKEEFEESAVADNIEITPDLTEEAEQALQGTAEGIRIRGQSTRSSKGKASPEGQMAAYTFSDKASSGMRTIKGLVVEAESGEPLPGVTVVLKGSSQGTITDIQGQFELSIPADKGSTLTFAFIGYEPEEVQIEDEEEIRLALAQDIMALDEVVVVGYGSVKKSELTGAVATVSAEDISGEPTVAPSVVIHPRPECKTREFKDYIQENIRYDQLPELEKAVVVKLKFTITASGEITDISIQRSGGEAFDNEAIRLLKEGPDWLPGSVDGMVTEDEADIKIKFEPQGD